MTSGRCCGGGPGARTDAAGPGTRQELRASSRKNGVDAQWRKERPTRQAGAEGFREPPGPALQPLPPQRRRKGERLRERSTTWERHPAALPSWSWGRPQGRAGGWHEGGRICGGESCRLSGGPVHGPRDAGCCSPVSPRDLAEKALLSLGNEGWGCPLTLCNSRR